MRGLVGACAIAALVCSRTASAQSNTSSTTDVLGQIETLVVTGSRKAASASAEIVRRRDLLLRPRRRPADILEVVPGLEVVQHAGGGKANQYFIRGFDADHGTDLALSVDGVPVNMVSHGHGQGYADLHFLIPELVDRIEVKKGPYFAELGDFATAGAVDIRLIDRAKVNSIEVGGGSFDTYRGLAIGGFELGSFSTLLAGEVYATNGPSIEKEELRRYNLFGRTKTEVFGGDLTLTLQGYGAKWHGSSQIPNREVVAGRLDRFGTIDATEGGSSQRFGAYAEWQGGGLTALAYVTQAHLQLFSDFTFFSVDPIHGDEIEQTDDRIIAGADVRYAFTTELGPMSLTSTFGLQTRSDFIDNGLYHDEARSRLATTIESNVKETSVAAFASEELQLTDWLRAQLGVRGDWFHFDVDGSTKDALFASPKATLIGSFDRTEIFGSAGIGYHSNDARGVVAGGATPLVRAIGGEVGARTKLFDRVELAASVFLIDLGSEIVWVGDEGTTEASGKTRRIGLEAEARVQIFRWLWADADFTATRGRFVDAPEGANRIPLAPALSLDAGLSMVHPIGIFGRVGVLHLWDRPATEDGFLTAKGVTKADLTLGYRNETFEVSVDVENLLNADVREAQFATVSRLRDESSCAVGTRAVSENGSFVGCEDLHFTPGPPLSARISASLFF